MDHVLNDPIKVKERLEKDGVDFTITDGEPEIGGDASQCWVYYIVTLTFESQRALPGEVSNSVTEDDIDPEYNESDGYDSDAWSDGGDIIDGYDEEDGEDGEDGDEGDGEDGEDGGGDIGLTNEEGGGDDEGI